MRKAFNKKFNRSVCEVYAGEYHITTDPQVVLSTLLGSCVAVCLRDSFNKVAGINHIMLSATTRPEEMLTNQDARYGIHAMELLINELMKAGANRNRLEAKVFGGGKVLKKGAKEVGYSNVEFAVSYLNNEEVPILARDTGGEGGRKIYFFPADFSVYLRRIEMVKPLKQVKEQEEKYLKKLKEQKPGESYLFE
jgi:chemotaxis protein CheD